MATTVSATNDIKADVRELAHIAIEDKASKDNIGRYADFYKIEHKDLLEKQLKHDLVVSDITGINQVSKRFADKLLFVLSKYQHDGERNLIFKCIYMMVDQARNHARISS
ncbi:MAG: hypothetical protein JO327_11175 [Nitrososphaeraceae archaeon]|nr:hypothetical protein [Nitrososphaeraceae archaeon]